MVALISFPDSTLTSLIDTTVWAACAWIVKINEIKINKMNFLYSSFPDIMPHFLNFIQTANKVKYFTIHIKFIN